MSVADKIGLLPGFGWMAGHGFWVTLVICWALTPGMMFVLGIVGESRLIPIAPDRQFVSFFPGDLFLGVTATGLLTLAPQLPAEHHWYNATWWSVLVLICAVVVAVVMTWFEWSSGAYTTRAIFSPTKLYHNGVLYIGYGSVIVTTLVTTLMAVTWSWLNLGLLFGLLVPGFVWAGLIVVDNTSPSDVRARKAAGAHTPHWKPIWRRVPWDLRV